MFDSGMSSDLQHRGGGSPLTYSPDQLGKRCARSGPGATETRWARSCCQRDDTHGRGLGHGPRQVACWHEDGIDNQEDGSSTWMRPPPRQGRGHCVSRRRQRRGLRMAWCWASCRPGAVRRECAGKARPAAGPAPALSGRKRTLSLLLHETARLLAVVEIPRGSELQGCNDCPLCQAVVTSSHVSPGGRLPGTTAAASCR
jgi:hypothetical protein